MLGGRGGAERDSRRPERNIVDGVRGGVDRVAAVAAAAEPFGRSAEPLDNGRACGREEFCFAVAVISDATDVEDKDARDDDVSLDRA